MTHCTGPTSVCACPACTRARNEKSEAFLKRPRVRFPNEMVADEIRSRGCLGKEDAWTLVLLDVLAERDRLRKALEYIATIPDRPDRVHMTEFEDALQTAREALRCP